MMSRTAREQFPVQQERDVVICRNRVKEVAVSIGMGLVNQTKLITAVSELTRNMLRYGGGGNMLLEIVSRAREQGVQVIFEDQGPGIPDIKKAMQDGFTTGKSMGMGLPGAKRLVSEFTIESTVGVGTTVKIIKWKNG